jgi:beta-glucanase (GH16 family)
VSNGVLAIRASSRANGWYSDLIDTKYTWTQRYGTFEARIRVPRGKGLWPAFWGYYNSGTGYVGELDAMEVCANPVGLNNGNDVTLLHNYVHWANNGSAGLNTRTVDLSEDYHVYAIDWRADHVSFYLDGVETWRYTDTTHIPNVPLPIILNLGVGGSWCSPPDATTPDGATMLVDWVRVRP